MGIRRLAMRKLSRRGEHRISMLKTMTDQLVTHERIRTTVPKAKELRRMVDHVVMLGRKGDFNARKEAWKYLRSSMTVNKLFDEIGPRYEHRVGGYTRLLRCGFRRGDGAPMCFIELVDREGELRPARPVGPVEGMEVVVEGEAAQAAEAEGRQ